MSERITDADIRQLVDSVNLSLSATPANEQHITVEWAYGMGSRLMTHGGAREITPRLRNREMYEVLRGMIAMGNLYHQIASEMLTGEVHVSLIARWATGN